MAVEVGAANKDVDYGGGTDFANYGRMVKSDFERTLLARGYEVVTQAAQADGGGTMHLAGSILRSSNPLGAFGKANNAAPRRCPSDQLP